MGELEDHSLDATGTWCRFENQKSRLQKLDGNDADRNPKASFLPSPVNLRGFSVPQSQLNNPAPFLMPKGANQYFNNGTSPVYSYAISPGTMPFFAPPTFYTEGDSQYPQPAPSSYGQGEHSNNARLDRGIAPPQLSGFIFPSPVPGYGGQWETTASKNTCAPVSGIQHPGRANSNEGSHFGSTVSLFGDRDNVPGLIELTEKTFGLNHGENHMPVTSSILKLLGSPGILRGYDQVTSPEAPAASSMPQRTSQIAMDKLFDDAKECVPGGRQGQPDPALDLQSEEGVARIAQGIVDYLVSFVNASCSYSQDVMELSAKVTNIMDAAMNMIGRDSPSTIMTNGTKLVHPDEFKNPSTFLKIYGDPLCFSNQGPLPKRGRSGNWECPRCRNVNFPRRFRCNKCSTSRDENGDRIVSDYAKQVYERYVTKSYPQVPNHNRRNSAQGLPQQVQLQQQQHHMTPGRHGNDMLPTQLSGDSGRLSNAREVGTMPQNRSRAGPPPVPSTFPLNWKGDERSRGQGDRRQTVQDVGDSRNRQVRKCSSHSECSGIAGNPDGTVMFNRNVSVHKYTDGVKHEHGADDRQLHWAWAPLEAARSMDFMPKPKVEADRSGQPGVEIKQPQFTREAFSYSEKYNGGSDFDRGSHRAKDYSNFVGFCSAFTRIGSDLSNSRDN